MNEIFIDEITVIKIGMISDSTYSMGRANYTSALVYEVKSRDLVGLGENNWRIYRVGTAEEKKAWKYALTVAGRLIGKDARKLSSLLPPTPRERDLKSWL